MNEPMPKGLPRALCDRVQAIVEEAWPHLDQAHGDRVVFAARRLADELMAATPIEHRRRYAEYDPDRNES